MMKFITNIFRRNKKAFNEKISTFVFSNQLQEAIEEYLRVSDKSSIDNWIIVRYVKKDSEVLYKVANLKNQSIKLKETFYIVDSRAIQFLRIDIYNKKTKQTFGLKIPLIDIYEGRTEAISHEKWCNDIALSEEFQKTVFLELKQGILDARKKQQATLRQILVYGLIALVAVVLIGSIFFN